MMNKKRIRRVLDNQKTIEEMANPFNRDIFYDLMEILYWVKFLEREGTLTKEETAVVSNWETTGNSKTKNKIVNEVYVIMEIMDKTQGVY